MFRQLLVVFDGSSHAQRALAASAIGSNATTRPCWTPPSTTVPDDVPVIKVLKHGAAGAEIVDVAGAGHHDLIVMGSVGMASSARSCSAASATALAIKSRPGAPCPCTAEQVHWHSD
jgi:hypothetical protein